MQKNRISTKCAFEDKIKKQSFPMFQNKNIFLYTVFLRSKRLIINVTGIKNSKQLNPSCINRP